MSRAAECQRCHLQLLKVSSLPGHVLSLLMRLQNAFLATTTDLRVLGMKKIK